MVVAAHAWCLGHAASHRAHGKPVRRGPNNRICPVADGSTRKSCRSSAGSRSRRIRYSSVSQTIAAGAPTSSARRFVALRCGDDLDMTERPGLERAGRPKAGPFLMDAESSKICTLSSHTEISCGRGPARGSGRTCTALFDMPSLHDNFVIQAVLCCAPLRSAATIRCVTRHRACRPRPKLPAHRKVAGKAVVAATVCIGCSRETRW
jgi:hypothetical protein